MVLQPCLRGPRQLEFRWMSWFGSCWRLAGSVADQVDALPHGDPALKNLLRMSWRSLILMAVARSHQYFTRNFLARLKPSRRSALDFCGRGINGSRAGADSIGFSSNRFLKARS